MKNLTEFESRKLLKKYGFSLPKAKLAKDAFSAAAFAGKIGYPVVLKIMSPDILHKSDSGCVKTGIGSPSEVHVSFPTIVKNTLAHNPNAKIDGILVEETLHGTEVIIGAKHDPQFGPIVLFGLGGVFVEVLADAAIRLAPIDRTDARKMISEVKGKKLLEGYRGVEPVNLKALEDALLKISRMIVEHPQIKEMDINPLFAGEKRAVVGDARIILK